MSIDMHELGGLPTNGSRCAGVLNQISKLKNVLKFSSSSKVFKIS